MDIWARICVSIFLSLILGAFYWAGLSETKSDIVKWAEEYHDTADDGAATAMPRPQIWVRLMGFPFANWGIAKHGLSSESDDLHSPGDEKGWIQLQFLFWFCVIFVLLSIFGPKKKLSTDASTST